jgi:DNA-directed RNA polymerase subunit RPC12/RpoP
LCYHQADFGGALGVQKPAKESVMAVTGYCLKCKKKVDISNPQHITMKNGKPATTGTCPTCGTKIYKIGKA